MHDSHHGGQRDNFRMKDVLTVHTKRLEDDHVRWPRRHAKWMIRQFDEEKRYKIKYRTVPMVEWQLTAQYCAYDTRYLYRAMTPTVGGLADI